MGGAIELAELLEREQVQFAELLGTIHSLRFTGAITLKFLNGQPQEVELGRPCVIKFPQPEPLPVAVSASPCTKSLDTVDPPASSS